MCWLSSHQDGAFTISLVFRTLFEQRVLTASGHNNLYYSDPFTYCYSKSFLIPYIPSRTICSPKLTIWFRHKHAAMVQLSRRKLKTTGQLMHQHALAFVRLRRIMVWDVLPLKSILTVIASCTRAAARTTIFVYKARVTMYLNEQHPIFPIHFIINNVATERGCNKEIQD